MCLLSHTNHVSIAQYSLVSKALGLDSTARTASKELIDRRQTRRGKKKRSLKQDIFIIKARNKCRIKDMPKEKREMMRLGS